MKSISNMDDVVPVHDVVIALDKCKLTQYIHTCNYLN